MNTDNWWAIFKILELSEEHFDSIVCRAGGHRIEAPIIGKAAQSSADYLLGNCIVELKLVKEEGLEKQSRQMKLAALFQNQQKNRPVIVIDPRLLDDLEKRKYYRIMETPLKSHISKADKQLKKTKSRLSSEYANVLFLVNVGFTALTHEEFVSIAHHRVTHDTTQIDYLVTAGAYFYGDGFDFYSLFPFDVLPVNVVTPSEDIKNLRIAWNEFVEEMMTNVVTGKGEDIFDRTIAFDLSFEQSSIFYVKPTPPIGKPSDFFINGRPRRNSTGIETCPPVGIVFPHFDNTNWNKARRVLLDPYELKETYSDYVNLEQSEECMQREPTMPFVPLQIEWDGFVLWANKNGFPMTFGRLCRYASELFAEEVRQIGESAIDATKTVVVPSQYVHLIVTEIGQDLAFDMSSAFLVREHPDGTRNTEMFSYVKAFFEYGLAIAAAYAVKYKQTVVVYEKDDRFKWQ